MEKIQMSFNRDRHWYEIWKYTAADNRKLGNVDDLSVAEAIAIAVGRKLGIPVEIQES